jgi:hypothetical protein
MNMAINSFVLKVFFLQIHLKMIVMDLIPIFHSVWIGGISCMVYIKVMQITCPSINYFTDVTSHRQKLR